MKAIIKELNQNWRNFSDNKEMVSTYDVIGTYKGQIVNVVTCCCYMGRSRSASTVYASIWVSVGPVLSEDGERVYFSNSCAGHGSAGIELYGNVYNNGYRWNHAENRENTPEEIRAIERREAKKRAHIGGVGDSAIESALLAIGKAVLGSRAKLTITRN